MPFRPANLVHTDEGSLVESTTSELEDGSPEPGTRSSAVEHALHTGGVAGSIPAASTILGSAKAPYWGFYPPLSWQGWEEPMWLYVIAQKQSRKPIKIGISRNIEQRIVSLEAGNPRGLVLLHKRQTKRAIAAQIERRLHQHFAAQAIGREWFDLTVGQVREPMEKLVVLSRQAMKTLRHQVVHHGTPDSPYFIRKDARWAA